MKRIGAGDYAPGKIYTGDGRRLLLDLDAGAGTYRMLALVSAKEDPETQVLLRILRQANRIFEPGQAELRAVGMDFPPDISELESEAFVCDPELRVAAAFGVLAPGEGDLVEFTPSWMIIGPDRRVLQRYPFAKSDAAFERFMMYVSQYRQRRSGAPVLERAQVLEVKLCQNLISVFSPIARALSSAPGLEVAAFAGTEQRDWVLRRLESRLVPELARAFNFSARAIEYLTFVKRLPSNGPANIRLSDQAGRQHGGFAVWIPLDKENHLGGQVSFPEYSAEPFDPVCGSALVHSVRVLRRIANTENGVRHFVECVIQP